MFRREKQLTSEEVFRTMTVPQALRVMLVPSVLSQLIVLIYNLADTYYVGQTNDPYMVAGVSLILPLFNVSLALGTMFGSGGGALLPKLLALERREEASRVAAYCIRMAIGTAALFSVLMLLFMQPLLTLLGAGANTSRPSWPASSQTSCAASVSRGKQGSAWRWAAR